MRRIPVGQSLISFSGDSRTEFTLRALNCNPFGGDYYLNIVYPGINDLRDKQYNMNDKIASYSCS